MTVRRLMILAGAATLAVSLSQGAASAHVRHHHAYYRHVVYRHVVYRRVYHRPVYYRHVYYRRHYAPYAGYYGSETSADIQYPYGGPRLLESRPVPDTEYNRMRFGGPMSYGGRMTAPIGN